MKIPRQQLARVHDSSMPTHALQPYACVQESAACRPKQYRAASYTRTRQRTNTSQVHAWSSKFPDNDPVNNPDFDDLVLDDEYYKEMGMTQEDIEAQMAFKATDVDPMGEDVTLDSLFKTRKGLPRHLMDQSAAAEQPGWGPDVVLVAGFRAEEVVMIRVVLDSAGADAVKLVVAGGDTLHMPAEAALQLPEPDWEQPRQLSDIGYGGGWGSQRTILFSGLSLKAQATLIELLEDSGLPPVCATAVTAATARDPVGALLAEAVKEQRERRHVSSSGHDWESDMAQQDAPLTPVEELLAQQTTERLKELSDDMEGGSIDHWFDREDGDEDTPEGFTVSLEDVLAAKEMKRQQQQQQGRSKGEEEKEEEEQGSKGEEEKEEEQVAAQAGADVGQAPQHASSSVVDKVLVQTIPPAANGNAPHNGNGHTANGHHTNGKSSNNGHSSRNGSTVIEADAAELEGPSNEQVSDATAAPPLDVESTVVPQESSENSSGQEDPKTTWSSTYSEVDPEEAQRLWSQYKIVQDDEDDQGGDSSMEDVARAAADAERPPVNVNGQTATGKSPTATPPSSSGVGSKPSQQTRAAAPPPPVDDAVQQRGDDAEAWLLDTIAGGEAASLDQVVAKLSDMGEAARQRAAAMQAAEAPLSVDEISGVQNDADVADMGVESGVEAGQDVQGAAQGMESQMLGHHQHEDDATQQGRVGLPNEHAASKPGAKDPFDFGFRDTTTYDGVPEHPLEGFREATWRALDAGFSAEMLVAIVEEAARGGSPVMRYRAWDPSGAHVDDAPPPVMQSNGNTMTKAQLREVAARNGLSYERLLEDAQRKGVLLSD